MQKKSIRLIQSSTTPLTLFSFTKGQLSFLKKNRFEVFVLSSPGWALDEVGKSEDVPTYEISMCREIEPIKDLIALYKIFLLFHKLKPTIVQGGTPKAALLSLVAAFLLRVPIRIYLIHGLRSEGLYGWKKKVVKCVETICCWSSNRVLSVSESVKMTAIEERICKPQKIGVLHHGTVNGIDAVFFNPMKFSESEKLDIYRRTRIPINSRILLFVGRLVRDKGVVELYESWKILKKKYTDLYMFIVGEEEPEDPVPANVISNLEKDSSVKMFGRVNDLTPLYSIATLLVLPTYREGFPYVPMEASAMELPVVGTHVTGCVDAVVHGITGTLVPPRDVDALTTAVSMYLDDEKLRKKHGKAGRERIIKDFQPIDIWRQLYNEYIRLLENKGISVPD